METILHQVAGMVNHHARRMDEYIREQKEFQTEAREAIAAVERRLPSHDEFGQIRKDVRELQTLKNRAIGWVAAVIFATTLLWEIFGPSMKFFKGG
jgi:hypothetical protein